jgi:hypothetical protein
MPTITIREIDNTSAEESTYDDYVVLVPGTGVVGSSFMTNNKAVLYEDLSVFKKAVSTTASSPTSKGYEIAIRLLALGLKVLYAPYKLDTVNGFDFSPYEDKAKYDIRFIVLGDALDETDIDTKDTNSVLKKSVQNAISSAAKRGDAIALIDIPSKETSSTESIKTWVNKLVVADVAKLADTYDGSITYENAFKYSAAFAPRFTYKGQNTAYFSGTLGYLSCFAYHKAKFADWFAFSGSVRGVLPYESVVTEQVYGDADIAQLQKRSLSDSETSFKAVNAICEIRPYGNIVWGNRTLFPIDSINTGLKASSFLNIRNLCCDIKKTLYRASRKYSFDPNSDTLWVNFKSAITPLLEKMKTGQGIKGYKIIKEKSKQKATLKARIKIIPIEAVEDFDLTVEMSDTITTVTE